MAPLSIFFSLLGGLLLIALQANADTPPPPQAFKASYRLLFDGRLVGKAYFELKRPASDRYVFEAYTTPAGQQPTGQNGNILEISRGQLNGNIPKPDQYTYSAENRGNKQLINLAFKHRKKELQIHNGNKAKTLKLQQPIQDRLSYLLRARALAAAKDSDTGVFIAELEASVPARLTPLAQKKITTPQGSYMATGVQRTDVDDSKQRILWFAPKLDYLPVRIEQSTSKGTAVLELDYLPRR